MTPPRTWLQKIRMWLAADPMKAWLASEGHPEGYDLVLHRGPDVLGYATVVYFPEPLAPQGKFTPAPAFADVKALLEERQRIRDQMDHDLDPDQTQTLDQRSEASEAEWRSPGLSVTHLTKRGLPAKLGDGVSLPHVEQVEFMDFYELDGQTFMNWA